MMATVVLDIVVWSHGLCYDLSMLEYKVIKFPPWLFSAISNTPLGRKTHAPNSQRLETVTLILPLEATTVNNTIDSSGVTVE